MLSQAKAECIALLEHNDFSQAAPRVLECVASQLNFWINDHLETLLRGEARQFHMDRRKIPLFEHEGVVLELQTRNELSSKIDFILSVPVGFAMMFLNHGVDATSYRVSEKNLLVDRRFRVEKGEILFAHPTSVSGLTYEFHHVHENFVLVISKTNGLEHYTEKYSKKTFERAALISNSIADSRIALWLDYILQAKLESRIDEEILVDLGIQTRDVRVSLASAKALYSRFPERALSVLQKAAGIQPSRQAKLLNEVIVKLEKKQ